MTAALLGGRGEPLAVRAVLWYRSRPRTGPGCCRLEPTCSAYGLQALREHGTARGGLLTARRLLRCRPGGPTGADPVPARRLAARR